MEDTRRLQVNNNIYRGVSSKRNRTVSRKKSKGKKQNIKLAFLLINLVAILVLFAMVVGSYSEMVRLSSNNVISQSRLDDLSIELASIESMALESSSSQKVEKIAESRLNMVYPSTDNLVALDVDSFDRGIDRNNISAKSDDEELTNPNTLDLASSGEQ